MIYLMCLSWFQGALHEAKGFAVPLKMFAQHVHEGKPRLWTYLEDELFIAMNPELREHLGQPVSITKFDKKLDHFTCWSTFYEQHLNNNIVIQLYVHFCHPLVSLQV